MRKPREQTQYDGVSWVGVVLIFLTIATAIALLACILSSRLKD
jgi:hypothetical protein